MASPNGELNVDQISRILNWDNNTGTTSKNLKYLQKRNIVEYRRNFNGEHLYYLCLTAEIRDYVQQLILYWRAMCPELKADIQTMHRLYAEKTEEEDYQIQ